MVDIYNHLIELRRLEIIFKDKNGIPCQLMSHIKSVENDRILISPPSIRGKVTSIDDGTKIKLIICTEEGIFSANSTVISKELSHTAGLWISFPYNTQHCQRREYLRAPVHLDFDLTIFKDREKQISETRTYKTKNLSGRGLNFISEEPLDDYYEIVCKLFSGQNRDVILETGIEHIYSKKIDIAGEQKYMHALAFTNVSEQEIDKIVKICFKQQLEQRRNEKFYQA